MKSFIENRLVFFIQIFSTEDFLFPSSSFIRQLIFPWNAIFSLILPFALLCFCPPIIQHTLKYMSSFSSKILGKSEYMDKKGWNQVQNRVQGQGQDPGSGGKIFLTKSGCVSDDPRGICLVPSIRASERNKSNMASK